MGGVVEGPVSPVGVEGVDVVGEVGDEEVEIPVAVVVPRVNAHARLGAAVLAVGQPGGGADLAEPEFSLVAEQEIGLGVVGHVDVGISVGIEIGEHDSESRQAVAGDAGPLPGLREAAPAQVAIQPVRLAGDPLGSAVAAQALVAAPEPAAGRIGEIELHVVGDVQVQQPVAVQIPEGGAGAPAAVGHARRPPRLGEALSPLVEVEAVGAPVGHVEIRIAVVVGVAHGAAHAPAGVGQAELLGRLLEERSGSGSAMAVEPVACGLGGVFEAGAVHQVEVLVPVPLDVEKGGPGGDGLEDVALLGTAGDVLVVDAAFPGHVDEEHGPGAGIGLACRRDGAHLGGGRSRPAARPVLGGDANVAAGPGDLFVAGARPGIRGTGDGEEGQEESDPPSGSPRRRRAATVPPGRVGDARR